MQGYASSPCPDYVNLEVFATRVLDELRVVGCISQRQLAAELGLKYNSLLGVLHTLEVKKRITSVSLGVGDRLVMLAEESKP